MADEVIEIEDIVDGDSLERWLTDWPVSQGLDEEAARQIAVTVEHRTAMRVMPIWWDGFLSEDARNGDLTALPTLHSLINFDVDARSPTPEKFPAAAVFATVMFANAAFTTDSTATAAFTAAAWASIRADCTKISVGVDVFATPLWSDQENPVADLWTSVKSKVSEPEWVFWMKWYDDALAGRAPNWDMLEQIALIDSEVWDAGPVAVAAEIERIKLKYEALAPIKPNAVVIQNAVANNLAAIPPQIEALTSTIDVEIERLRGKNAEDDMEKQEIDQLIGTFKSMRSAVVGLSQLLPSKGVPTTEAAEEMGGLLQVFGSEFRKWPMENAADLVDSSCRVVLIGLTAGLLTAFGLPVLAGTAIGGIAFGGKKLVGIGKALKDVAPTGT